MKMKIDFKDQDLVFAFKKIDVKQLVEAIEKVDFSELTHVKKVKNEDKDLIYVRSDECTFHIADDHLILETKSTDDSKIKKIADIINRVLTLVNSYIKDHTEDEIISACEFRVDIKFDKMYNSFIDNDKLSNIGLGEIVSKGLRLDITKDDVSIILDTSKNYNRLQISKTYAPNQNSIIDLVGYREFLFNYVNDLLIKLGVNQ